MLKNLLTTLLLNFSYVPFLSASDYFDNIPPLKRHKPNPFPSLIPLNKEEKKKFSSDDLLNSLPAIHLTNHFPNEGKMIAGAYGLIEDTAKEEPPSFRPTLHFSLGSPVQSVSKEGTIYSWGSKKYAIILPLRQLFESNQLININCDDTFILGDFVLPKGSYVLVPEVEYESLNLFKGENITLISYKRPPEQSVDPYEVLWLCRNRGPRKEEDNREKDEIEKIIRESVSDLIKKIGWSEVNMYSNLTSASLKEAFLSESKQEINNLEFFQPLLDSAPQLVFGSHQSSLFGRIEDAIQTLSTPYTTKEYTLAENSLNYIIKFIENALEYLEKNLVSSLPEISRRTYERKKENLKGWINIAHVDLFIRNEHKKLFKKMNDGRVYQHRHSYEHLKNAAIKILLRDRESEREQTNIKQGSIETHSEKDSSQSQTLEGQLKNLYVEGAVRYSLPFNDKKEFNKRRANLPETINFEHYTILFVIDTYINCFSILEGQKQALNSLLDNACKEIKNKEEKRREILKYMKECINDKGDARASFCKELYENLNTSLS